MRLSRRPVSLRGLSGRGLTAISWRPAIPPALRAWRHSTLLLNVGLGVLILAGAALAYRTVAVSTSTATPTGVRYLPVTQGNVTSSVSATGTVGSANQLNVDFVTAGT